MLIIISILMLYVASNSRALLNMQRELKLLDLKQRQRLDTFFRTNGAAGRSPAKPESERGAGPG
jgi:hypothetical protein